LTSWKGCTVFLQNPFIVVAGFIEVIADSTQPQRLVFAHGGFTLRGHSTAIRI